MTTLFKIKLLEFIDELFHLFHNNKIIYKRLIYYHHIIKNTLDEDNLETISIEFLSNENIFNLITQQNIKFLTQTSIENDFELLWNSCTFENKNIIWKWIYTIIGCIEFYLPFSLT